MKKIFLIALSIVVSFSVYSQSISSPISIVKRSSIDIAPAVQTTNIYCEQITDVSFVVTFTPGNGLKRIVLIKSGSAVDATPANNITYTANSAFGSGSQLGTGNYCVYNGTGSSVSVTGLTSDVTYHVRVFDYNGATGNEKYITTTATVNPSSQYTVGGLMKQLWDQTNNKPTPKLRLGFNHPSNTNAQPLWSSSNSYGPFQNVTYPTTNTLSPVYVTYENLAVGEQVPPSNPKWHQQISADIIQPVGNGTDYFRTTLGFVGDEWIRQNIYGYGTVAESQTFLTRRNYDDPFLGTSTTTFTPPTSHPTSRTITTQAGLNITNGQTIKLQNTEFNWVVGTVTSYNSGTGQLDYSSTLNGSLPASASSWNLFSGRPPSGIPQTIPTGNNLYWGRFNGEYLDLTCTGNVLVFSVQKDNTGKAWSFHYMSGPDSGSPPADAVVDCYNATSLGVVQTTPMQFTNIGTHHIRATIINTPSGSGTNAFAWVTASASLNSSQCTISESVMQDVFTRTLELSPGGNSMGEMAYNYRINANGGEASRWLPLHTVWRTMTGRDSRHYYVDGVEINVNSFLTNPYAFKYLNFTKFELTQRGEIWNDQSTTQVGTWSSRHIYTSRGLEYIVDITWSVAVLINTGYDNQVYLSEWWTKLKTGNGNYYDVSVNDVTQNIASGDRQQRTYAFYAKASGGSAPATNICAAQFWPNTNDWRTGANSGTSFIQDFSGTSGKKFYPYVWQGYVTTPGEKFRIHSQFYIGNYVNADSGL